MGGVGRGFLAASMSFKSICCKEDFVRFPHALPKTIMQAISEFTQQDGKTLVCNKRDRHVTYVFCGDLHLS